MWLVGVVIRRYIDILIIIINFPYSICIRSFFGSSILTSLFIFKCFFKNKNKNKNKKPKWLFLLRAARTETALLWRCYTLILLEISRRTRCWCLKYCTEVWMTILESGWNLWVWLVGVVSRRWVWLVGGIYGYGYNV